MAIGSLLTAKEVAKRLRVSVGRVHQFVMEGRLQFERKLGPNSLFDKDVVERFAQQPRRNGRPRKTA